MYSTLISEVFGNFTTILRSKSLQIRVKIPKNNEKSSKSLPKEHFLPRYPLFHLLLYKTIECNIIHHQGGLIWMWFEQNR